MATFNSLSQPRLAWRLAATLVILIAGDCLALAGEGTNDFFAAHARAEYQGARIRYQADIANITNGWEFARACFDAADVATNDEERASLAREGIAACRQSIEKVPRFAPSHYYLGMNLGQLARAEFLGALGTVKEMEHEFKLAASLDPHLDYAGPERSLGLLYLEAPAIGSIGSNRKAREFLERAAKLEPDYPENHLNLAEMFLKWDEPEHARQELNLLDSVWSKAQTNLTGIAWAESWYDWSNRRAAAGKKLGELSSR